MEGETGVRHLRANKPQGQPTPPEAGKKQGAGPLEPSEREHGPARLILDF